MFWSEFSSSEDTVRAWGEAGRELGGMPVREQHPPESQPTLARR